MPHTLGCDFQKGKRGSLKKDIIENDHFYISVIMDGDFNDTILYFEFTRYFVKATKTLQIVTNVIQSP